MTAPPIPLLALQLVGLACIIVAAWMIRDGWAALGVFGVALVTVAELVDRRLTGQSPPDRPRGTTPEG